MDRQLDFLIGVPINEVLFAKDLIEVIKPDSFRQSLAAWFSHTQAPFATVCLIFWAVIPGMMIKNESAHFPRSRACARVIGPLLVIDCTEIVP